MGNTESPGSVRSSRSVHPHACGEHCRVLSAGTILAGSSPRLWGTPSPNWAVNLHSRFIPTPVGNTFILFLLLSGDTVHPHACGEHI
ncbi:hypothetical protein D1AOALGA4SA_11466 [Olavius algarvensis Delta 1 endosymbiont]|nr:hypothetical protein D1AOALGA4SA_11466 [Olavius algarvensis Delta 1 endosymbiont]